MHIPALDKFLPQIQLSPELVAPQHQLYIWGRNPELSVAELISRAHGGGITPRFLDLSREGGIAGRGMPVKIRDCGAILKRAEVLAALPYDIGSEGLNNEVYELLNAEYMEEKCAWGISQYNLPNEADSEAETAIQFADGVESAAKRALKKMKVRKTQILREHNSVAISPRRLQRKEVLERGFELILWHQPALSQAVLAITREGADIDGFARRDVERPHRRPLLLLGLALARSMVNLSSITETRFHLPIYDPFCGMGSISAEAYMLGLAAWSSDIDAECVQQTRENLVWLAGHRAYRQPSSPSPGGHVFQMDITTPDFGQHPELQNFEGTIVAETNLLTPLQSYPDVVQAQEMLREFDRNYHLYLRGIAQILAPGAVGVMVFPQIHTKDNAFESLNIRELLHGYGFRILDVSVNNASFPAIFVHNWKSPIIERVIVAFQKQ